MKIKYFKWPIFISLLLMIALVQYSTPEVYAESPIKIVIDGKKFRCRPIYKQ